MKKILITGAKSYIGTSFEKYLSQWTENYQVDTLDMIDGSWRERLFSGYDVVLHVAGIAHVKETRKNRSLYYEINRDLAVETAKKAKAEGVRQFLFMSSMSVYGLDSGTVYPDTIPSPGNAYGMSKLQAENEINQLKSDSFRVCIVRPPMVYGKGCKGNFNNIISLIRKIAIFPDIVNSRSMIYIDHLCEFLRMACDCCYADVWTPANKEPMCTAQMTKWIANNMGKKLYFSKLLGVCVKISMAFLPLTRKAFGDLTYVDTERLEYSYCLYDNEETINRACEGSLNDNR